MTGWTISEWPWSGSLGERWSARPPVTPADQKWPGVRWFSSKADAEEFVRQAEEPHCIQCGNPYVEETVRVCCWNCLHAFAIGVACRGWPVVHGEL